ESAQADILRRWAEQSLPSTLGTHSTLLLALRRGLEQRVGEVRTSLAAHFTPRFAELLGGAGPAGCLERIRTQFRNPGAHAMTTFDPAAYGRFARLLVGRDRLAAWYERGPDPDPPDAAEA